MNHLLFDDDSLLFSGATIEETKMIKELSRVYCDASGQRINNDKSSIFFSKVVPVQSREAIILILQVSSETLSEKYLGLPTDVGRSKNITSKKLKDRL